MIKRLLTTVTFAALTSSAFAADLRGPIVEAPPAYGVIPAAAFSWSGGYVGVNVGVGSASPSYGYDVTTPPTSTPGTYYPGHDGFYVPPSDGYYVPPTDGYTTPGTYTPGSSAKGSQRFGAGGVLGGVQVGYNYAFGGGFGGLGSGGLGLGGIGLGGVGLGGIGIVPVIGVEADFDGSGVSSSGALGQFAQGFPLGTSSYVGVHSDLNYFGTVRGRLGVAFDRLLVFGTGGFAYGETDTSVVAPSNGVNAHKSNFHTGIAYGGGVEYAITNSLMLRAEYLHIDLNRKDVLVGGDAYRTYTLYEKPSLDLVRAGLDYRFDFATAAVAPVIARY